MSVLLNGKLRKNWRPHVKGPSKKQGVCLVCRLERTYELGLYSFQKGGKKKLQEMWTLASGDLIRGRRIHTKDCMALLICGRDTREILIFTEYLVYLPESCKVVDLNSTKRKFLMMKWIAIGLVSCSLLEGHKPVRSLICGNAVGKIQALDNDVCHCDWRLQEGESWSRWHLKSFDKTWRACEVSFCYAYMTSLCYLPSLSGGKNKVSETWKIPLLSPMVLHFESQRAEQVMLKLSVNF